MKTEYFFFYYGRHRNVVKEGGKHDPDIFIAEFFLALLVEAINLCDSSWLMISSS